MSFPRRRWFDRGRKGTPIDERRQEQWLKIYWNLAGEQGAAPFIVQ
jgi:hypothetical protein